MLKSVASAAGLVAVCAVAAIGLEAMAAAPKCKDMANKNVACTDKLKTKTAPKTNLGDDAQLFNLELQDSLGRKGRPKSLGPSRR
jgi:hypothetical protein